MNKSEFCPFDGGMKMIEERAVMNIGEVHRAVPASVFYSQYGIEANIVRVYCANCGLLFHEGTVTR